MKKSGQVEGRLVHLEKPRPIYFAGQAGYKDGMTDRRLTPITCRVCGKPATYEFLYKDKRMCVMCYMEAATGQPLAAMAHADRDMICEGCGRKSFQSIVYKKKTLCGLCYVKAFEAEQKMSGGGQIPPQKPATGT